MHLLRTYCAEGRAYTSRIGTRGGIQPKERMQGDVCGAQGNRTCLGMQGSLIGASL